jgi:hypothetical protein
MATALIHMDARQKQRLARRAKLRGKSFSQEVRDAVDMYLEVPVDTEEELELLAKSANQAADRMIKRLDATISHVDRILSEMERRP